MSTKTNKHQENRNKILLTALGAWAMAIATLIGATDISRDATRQPIVVGTARPAYVYEDSNVWLRSEKENETVHMPTEFDIGLQTFAVGGRK